MRYTIKSRQGALWPRTAVRSPSPFQGDRRVASAWRSVFFGWRDRLPLDSARLSASCYSLGMEPPQAPSLRAKTLLLAQEVNFDEPPASFSQLVEFEEVADARVIVHKVCIDARGPNRTVSHGESYLGQRTIGVKRMAYEGVPTIMDRYLRLPLGSKTLAASLESPSEVLAIELATERVAMLTAHKPGIIVGPLLPTETLPIGEITERSFVPGKWYFAWPVALGDFLANSDLWLAVVYLNIGEPQMADLANAQAGTAGQPKDDPIHSGVQGPTTFSSRVFEYSSDFRPLEDSRFVHSPRCHFKSPFTMRHEFDCFPRLCSETVTSLTTKDT